MMKIQHTPEHAAIRIRPLGYVVMLLIVFSSTTMHAQLAKQSTYLIVHGTWGGGWAFKKVDSLLSATGSVVYRPTLTGQGERVHLASREVDLRTHILDIVNIILYEDLHDVILVGHSYGGMIITGVADSIPDRIKKLVYLDALLPEHNENVYSILKHRDQRFQPVDGYIIPFWVPEGKLPPKDVPQPANTWSDQIILQNPDRLKVGGAYILTVEKGADPVKDEFYSQSQRATLKGWPVLYLTADHNAQWSAPDDLVMMLKQMESQ